MARITVRLTIYLLATFFIFTTYGCEEKDVPFNDRTQKAIYYLVENFSAEAITVVCTEADAYDDSTFLAPGCLEYIKVKPIEPNESFRSRCPFGRHNLKSGHKFQLLIFKQSTIDRCLDSFSDIVLTVDMRYLFDIDNLKEDTFYIKYTGQ